MTALHKEIAAQPWVVQQDIAHLRRTGDGLAIGKARITRVMLVPLDQRPDENSDLPAGAELLRAEAFPAERLARLRPDIRDRYAGACRAFLTWRRDLAGAPYETDGEIDRRVSRWIAEGYATANDD